MSFRRQLFVLLAILLPAAADGQAGSGRRPGNRVEIPELKSGHLIELSPARLVRENRKDLTLDDAQAAQLLTIGEAFDREAHDFADQVKHNQKIVMKAPPELKRPPEGKPPTPKDSVERAKLEASNQEKWDRWLTEAGTARRDLGETMLRIRATYDSSAVKTLALLRGDQKAKITPLLDRASEELSLRLRRANVR